MAYELLDKPARIGDEVPPLASTYIFVVRACGQQRRDD